MKHKKHHAHHKHGHPGIHHMGVQMASHEAHGDEKDAFHTWEHGYFHEGAPMHVGHDKKHKRHK